MQRLFGTDGIRGTVGQYPLTQKAVFCLGRALGLWLREQYPRTRPLRIAVGKDTRTSGEELELALLRGVKFAGLEYLRLGICPTPCVAYLSRSLKTHLGIAISASHNPGADNGIKFFNADGYKLFSAAERRLEEIFFDLCAKDADLSLTIGDINTECDYLGLYTDFIKDSLHGLDLSQLTIVLDCAFGSFSKIAPQILRDLGVNVLAMHNNPDGININVNCGTLYPQHMAKKILECKADMGIAFDGDGDRLIVADEKGNILDGDKILAILCKSFLEQNRLNKKSVICTQMSNMGLELWMAKLGVKMIRTAVGDKYVLEEMLKQRVNLGGEQSGHIIILENTTTGDGLMVAAEMIKLMLQTKRALSELVQNFESFPQVLVNVRVKEKRPLAQIPNLDNAIGGFRSQFGRAGRILVRYSGTENLVRIMVEGQEASLVNRVAGTLAEIIQSAVGEDK